MSDHLKIEKENRQFRAIVIEAAEISGRQARKDFPKLINTHEIIYNVLMGVVSERVGAELNIKNDSQSRRVSLCAQFLQGIEFCHHAILGSFYTQASSLIKQEMEIISAIKECELGTRVDKRTPNVRHLGDMARIYNHLNDICHASVNVIGNFIVGMETEDGLGASIYAAYKREIFCKFYFWHCFLIVEFFMVYDRLCQELNLGTINSHAEKLLQDALLELDAFSKELTLDA